MDELIGFFDKEAGIFRDQMGVPHTFEWATYAICYLLTHLDRKGYELEDMVREFYLKNPSMSQCESPEEFNQMVVEYSEGLSHKGERGAVVLEKMGKSIMMEIRKEREKRGPRDE